MNKILQGDSLEVLKTLDSEIVDCVITSPPYWGLRDYGVDGQIGLEDSFEDFVDSLCNIFDEVKRVLKPEGTCWVNLGDSYAAGGGKAVEQSSKRQAAISTNAYPDSPPNSKLRNKFGKSRLLIPHRFAIEMINRGWLVRNTIIWHKPSCMPESVKDRFTNDYEYIFFFVKQKKYYFKQQFDLAAYDGRKDTRMKGSPKYSGMELPKGQNPNSFIARGHERWTKDEQGNHVRNKRTVWKINTENNTDAHFATFPKELVKQCIEPGCPEKGLVLDPFMGSGTTAYVAKEMGRNYLGIELNPEYIEICNKRLRQMMLL